MIHLKSHPVRIIRGRLSARYLAVLGAQLGSKFPFGRAAPHPALPLAPRELPLLKLKHL